MALRVQLGALILVAAGPASAQATAYTAAPLGRYTDVDAPRVCAPPLSCRVYSTSMGPSGMFTTATPLPPNLVNADVEPRLASFRFSDGLEVYSHLDPATRVQRFSVSTDARGRVIEPVRIELDRWLPGASPRQAGARLASFALGPITVVRRNWYCAEAKGRPGKERCVSTSTDAATASAAGGTVAWSVKSLKDAPSASFAREPDEVKPAPDAADAAAPAPDQ